LAGALRAQSVQYFEKEKLWLLSTDHNSYVLAVARMENCDTCTGDFRCREKAT
jgi:hypothetical protein